MGAPFFVMERRRGTVVRETWPAALPDDDGFRTWAYPTPVAPEDATYLPGDAEVLAVETDRGARAYPVRTIQSHHIIHDRIEEYEVLVTF